MSLWEFLKNISGKSVEVMFHLDAHACRGEWCMVKELVESSICVQNKFVQGAIQPHGVRFVRVVEGS